MLKGTGISDGIGLGKAIIFKSQKIKLEKNKIKDVTLEKEKFYKAIKEVEKEIENLLEKISGTEKEIMQAYLLILQDPNLIQKTIEIIEKEKWNAAYATEIGFNEVIKEFEKGIEFKDEKCLPAKLETVGGDFKIAKVVIKQGMYHQVKRMFSHFKITVLELKRIKMGALCLDENLKEGECKYLAKEDISLLSQNQ